MAKAKNADANAKFGKCQCGCGGSLIAPNRQFLQGHDMKLKSRIKQALRNPGGAKREWALKTLGHYGWKGQVIVPDKPTDAR